MAKQGQIQDDFLKEFLTIGPFGGLDTTTAPYYVSPTNFVDGENFVPNSNYGGYITAQGRVAALASTLPSAPNGIFKLTRPGQSDVYLFAVDAGGQGAIYHGQLGGTATPLSLPAPLTPGKQTFFAESDQWVFVTNGADTPIKIDTNLNVTYWGIVAPVTPPTLALHGSGSMGPGYYNYCITFASASQESSQGAISSQLFVPVSNGVTLTNIPTSTDPQVTQRNIYRIGGALGQWRLIATLNDNTTTTYTDTQSDASITGQSLTINRDPPPKFTSIAAHQERIWGFLGSIVWYSNYGEPWGFNSVTGTLPVGNNSFGDDAVNLASIGSILVLFKSRTTYAVYGVTDADFQVNKLFDIGCVSALSVVSAYGTAFWASRQGIWMYGGGQPQQISDGQYQQSNIKSALTALTIKQLSTACSFMYDRMYHLSLPSIGRTYFYDLRSQQWFPLGWVCTQSYFDLESDVPVIAGDGTNVSSPGQITQWFAASTDLGSPITAYITSRVTDSDDLPTTKNYQYLIVEAPTQVGATCNVYIYVNPGSLQYQDAFTFDLGNQGTKHQVSLPMTFVGAELQMKLQTISSNPVVVHKAAIYGTAQRTFIPATSTN